jgi:cell division protein FtsW
MPLARNLFLSLACVLLGVGLLMVYSSSITARPTEFEQVYLTRHAAFLAFALACGVTAALLPAGLWRRAAPWGFALTLMLLAVVLIPGVGYHVNGAQRWLRYGSLSMQPSEVAKVTLPLFVCWWLSRRKRMHGFWLLAAIASVVLLVGKEPDLGTAAFLACSAALALFLGGWPLRNFCLAAAVAAPLFAGVVALRPYQFQRISTSPRIRSNSR